VQVITAAAGVGVDPTLQGRGNGPPSGGAATAARNRTLDKRHPCDGACRAEHHNRLRRAKARRQAADWPPHSPTAMCLACAVTRRRGVFGRKVPVCFPLAGLALPPSKPAAPADRSRPRPTEASRCSAAGRGPPGRTRAGPGAGGRSTHPRRGQTGWPAVARAKHEEARLRSRHPQAAQAYRSAGESAENDGPPETTLPDRPCRHPHMRRPTSTSANNSRGLGGSVVREKIKQHHRAVAVECQVAQKRLNSASSRAFRQYRLLPHQAGHPDWVTSRESMPLAGPDAPKPDVRRGRTAPEWPSHASDHSELRTGPPPRRCAGLVAAGQPRRSNNRTTVEPPWRWLVCQSR